MSSLDTNKITLKALKTRTGWNVDHNEFYDLEQHRLRPQHKFTSNFALDISGSSSGVTLRLCDINIFQLRLNG